MKSFLQKIKWFILPIFVLVSLQSCTKNVVNNLSTDETRTYVTQFDSTAQFNQYKTFSISDSITVIDNGQYYKTLTQTSQAFKDAIVKYMQLRGYTLVNKSSSPDLGIDVSFINNSSTSVIDYSSYWDYYGGYWDPSYWGYGYGGYGYYYPDSYGYYQINQQALSIDMLDLKNAAANNQIKIIWNGLIKGEGIDDATTADSQISTLFTQSPYLKAQ